MNSASRPGLYVHVPFCRSKCLYCDFYSVDSLEKVEPWVRAVCQEILLYCHDFEEFDTLYLGGGTPSLLPEKHLASLMERLSGHLTFSTGVEVTIEVNPDDVTKQKMAFLRSLGFNRVSLGVQSFLDDELRWLGRRHTADQAKRAVEIVRWAGFQNLALDLMYGFDGQDRQKWMMSLERAVGIHPEHLSCYILTLEDGTPLGRMKREGTIRGLGEEAESRLFLLTSRVLESHGFFHYEVSNFAKREDFISRHNLKYWTHAPYLGLGPAAHSFSRGTRWWNPRSIEAYCRLMADGRKTVHEGEVLTPAQLELESDYFGLRSSVGVDLRRFQRSAQAKQTLERWLQSGLVVIEGERVLPTPRGYLVADGLPVELTG